MTNTIDNEGSTSPVHEENGQWYFWDETWADRYGPYPTREIAEQKCTEYCRQL